MAQVKNHRQGERTCPECGEVVSRREFVQRAAAAGLATAGGAWLLGSSARAAPTPQSAAETAVARLYNSLTPEQRQVICFPFDHPLRQRISANWAITEPTIGKFFTNEQQAIIDEIFRGVTSEEGYERFLKQMDEDAGGFGRYHVAIFGEPGSGKFQFEMTGRHLTIRADGDSVEGTAFGGPIIYGHGTGDSEPGLPGNVFYYQTLKANELFQALDGAQRERALLPNAPRENDVAIQGPDGKFPGLALGELSPDQQRLAEEVIRIVLAPYRQEDVDEAMQILKATQGLEKLHLAYYKTDDIGDDQVWDIWRLEGPYFVWHFRGAPHVHAYVNIGLI